MDTEDRKQNAIVIASAVVAGSALYFMARRIRTLSRRLTHETDRKEYWSHRFVDLTVTLPDGDFKKMLDQLLTDAQFHAIVDQESW